MRVKLFQNIDPEKLLVIMSKGQPGAFWVVECQEQNTAHGIVHTPHRLHCSWIYCCLLLLGLLLLRDNRYVFFFLNEQ